MNSTGPGTGTDERVYRWLLRGVGLLVLAHEVLIAPFERPWLILLIAGLLNLPLVGGLSTLLGRMNKGGP